MAALQLDLLRIEAECLRGSFPIKPPQQAACIKKASCEVYAAWADKHPAGVTSKVNGRYAMPQCWQLAAMQGLSGDKLLNELNFVKRRLIPAVAVRSWCLQTSPLVALICENSDESAIVQQGRISVRSCPLPSCVPLACVQVAPYALY